MPAPDRTATLSMATPGGLARACHGVDARVRTRLGWGERMADEDLIRVLAAWALVHELADEGWKAAVGRGLAADEAGPGADRDIVDSIAALVFRRKEAMKAELAEGGTAPESREGSPMPELGELRFEVSEMRGRLEAIETALDALVRRLPGADAER